MSRQCGMTLMALLALAVVSARAGEPERRRPARAPAVAGAFYPARADRLRRAVATHMKAARPEVPEQFEGQRLIALIAPHAGYTYSGDTAAFCYKLLQGRPKPKRIILLGPSHHVWLPGAVSVPANTHYRTPLGEVPVDLPARDRLKACAQCVSSAKAHVPEHSLEVQLPFLQVVWDEAPPILPVIVGKLDARQRKSVADALRPLVDKDTLLVASTDFTHYGARFGYRPFASASGEELGRRIRELDMGAVKHIDALDAAGFLKYCGATGATICGRDAVGLLLEVLAGAGKVKGVSLHYDNSSRVAGSYENSVSYHAHAFYRADNGPTPHVPAIPSQEQ